MGEESSIERHLRAGQDRLARIGEAVEAFRRLSPADYGYFLATIEGHLAGHTAALGDGSAAALLLTAGSDPTSTTTSTMVSKEGSLRDAVLSLLSDGRERSTAEIRSELQAVRPVKAGTLNTEIFTLRKRGVLRTTGRGRGSRHSIAPSQVASSRAGAPGKREPTPKAPRRKRDDDEDHPARADRRAAGPPAAERIYAAAIGTHHLLSRDEELALAQRLEQTETAIWDRLLAGPLADAARARLLELDAPVTPTCGADARAADLDRLVATRVIEDGAHELAEPEAAAIRALCAEADRIRDRFAACNLRLVPSTVRRHGYHLTSSLSMGDLIQEGNFGLLKAIGRFDYRRGLRFSTFATWWIRHYLVRARQNLGAEVRVPVHLQDLAMKVKRAKVQLREKLGRDPSGDEVARFLKVPKKSIKTLESSWLKHREALPSFDSVGEDGVAPSYLASDADLADEVLVKHEEERRIVAAVAAMPRYLADIVRRRFGLDGSEPETLLQIAASVGLSRERIRQLEKKALTILRERIAAELPAAA